ncbi:UAA transporter family protein [Nitzschia inconspicua]|uniref:UAA transporter family protein n=1 Tax=Nitzschia inconspicua TaxID=303405 RepID=A0A9K3L1M6_9STRA|nr:UAA transporter family protein [Nitzschia inconspicua]
MAMSSKDESTLPLTTASQSSTPPSRKPIASNAAVFGYVWTFFTCMVIMELTLEGTQKAFHDFSGLAFAVTLFQFGCCFLLPVLHSNGATLKEIPKTPSAMLPYLLLSLFVFGSSGLATMSIRYVSYPTKVILKSTKLIPTMIMATLLQQTHGQRYGRLEYLAATLLCAGAAGYGFGESNISVSSHEGESYWGMFLLGTSVVCDAFTPNIQQRLMAPTCGHHDHATAATTTTAATTWKQRLHRIQQSIFPPGGLGVSASTLMTNANFVGGIGILIYMAMTRVLVEALRVALVKPSLLCSLTVIGMSLAAAVSAYTRLIQASGSVVAVGVATLRKMVTVILSYFFYPKQFSRTHAISSLLILAGVLLSTYAKQRPHIMRTEYPSPRTMELRK